MPNVTTLFMPETLHSANKTSARPALPQRLADFETLAEALDYAARSDAFATFQDARGNETDRLSYHQLRLDARCLARSLKRIGLRRGTKIGILAQTHPDFLRLFYACQYGGCIAVPLPVLDAIGGRSEYQHKLQGLIESSGVELLCATPDTTDMLRDCLPHLPPSRILSVPEIEAAARDTPENKDAAPDDADNDDGLNPLQADEISHVQYSSGSTSAPVGIEIGQRALMANARAIAGPGGLDLVPGDRSVSWLPFYHDMGLIGHCILPITTQCRIDLLPPTEFARSPLRWLQLISEKRATHSFAPDFGYELCIRLARRRQQLDLDLSCWQVAGIGGDMVKPRVLREFAEAFRPYGFDPQGLTPSYGLAEATLAVSFCPKARPVAHDTVDNRSLATRALAIPTDASTPFARTFVSCGRPLPGYHLRIQHPETQQILAERQVGVLHISGPSLMRGYHNDPERTHLALPDGAWLNTGDIGYLADGELFITGRIKEMIVVRGRNLWPQDIEWTIEREIEAFKSGDTAAFGLIGPDGRERVIVLAKCRSRDPEQRDNLIKDIEAAALHACGVECEIHLIPPGSLPRTTSGKLMRTRAKYLWIEGFFARTDNSAI